MELTLMMIYELFLLPNLKSVQKDLNFYKEILHLTINIMSCHYFLKPCHLSILLFANYYLRSNFLHSSSHVKS